MTASLIKTMHGIPPYAALAAAAAAVLLAWLTARWAARSAKRALSGRHADDVSTFISAGIATVIAANGSWIFFGTILHMSGAERAAMFAFLEFAVVTCAFRARRKMRDPAIASAGAEGLAVWVLSAMSGVFAATAAGSAGAALFRLSVPLVAAWLWERSLQLERRKATGRHINWTWTLERLLVRAGVAEPQHRNVSDVAASRHIAQLALAAKLAHDRRQTAARTWRQNAAKRRLARAMQRAVEHASLATDEARQNALMAQIAALHGADSLASLTPPPPWQKADTAADSAGDRETPGERQDKRQERRLNPATDRVRARAKAVRLVASNAAITPQELSAKCGVSERTAQRWRNEITAAQAEPLRAVQGGKR